MDELPTKEQFEVMKRTLSNLANTVATQATTIANLQAIISMNEEKKVETK